MERVLEDVRDERQRQRDKWGDDSADDHPDGTSARNYGDVANMARTMTNAAAIGGAATWRHIIMEELYEALAAVDPVRLRAELVQVAAVAVSWIEAIDRREQNAPNR